MVVSDFGHIRKLPAHGVHRKTTGGDLNDTSAFKRFRAARDLSKHHLPPEASIYRLPVSENQIGETHVDNECNLCREWYRASVKLYHKQARIGSDRLG
jgi:hypothetical protein